MAVDRADGSTARFVVLAVERYPKDAFPTERVYGDIDHAGLRLITCGGSFDRAAHGYRDNVVVYAGLVGSRPATGVIDGGRRNLRPCKFGPVSAVTRRSTVTRIPESTSPEAARHRSSAR